ncbi:MAG: glycosyltransferase family 2 protein [Pirellulaceae bacterium]
MNGLCVDAAKPDLSVVMPCLNEAETLGRCIEEAFSVSSKCLLSVEVIIADNGSTDGSQVIARELGAKVVDIPRRGYGAAIRGGVEVSQAEFVLVGDSDASYDFSDAGKFIEALREGNDLVVGNRFQGGIEVGAMPWKHRFIGNPVLSGIGQLFFNCGVGDFHCGLRAFTRSAYDLLLLNTDGMEFASEMIVRAKLDRLKITEVPTKLRKAGRSRTPHLRSWRDGWRHLRLLLVLCPMWLYCLPALAFSAVGCMGLFALAVQGPIRVGAVTFSINSSLVSGLLVVLGVQFAIQGLSASLLGEECGVWRKRHFLRFLCPIFSLEVGLALGLSFLLVGFIGIYCVAIVWLATAFQSLSAAVTLRAVIPSFVSAVVGMQIAFASFQLHFVKTASAIGRLKQSQRNR